MLTKCICTNCAGHLEFEEENAGETIPCPHCGFETILTLPGTEAPDPERLAWLRKRLRRRQLCRLGGALLLLAGLGYALYRWGVPWVEDLWPALDSTPKALTVLLLSCLILPFAVAWLIFPVLLCLQLRRLIQTVEQLAQSETELEVEPQPEPPTEIEVEPMGEEPPPASATKTAARPDHSL